MSEENDDQATNQSLQISSQSSTAIVSPDEPPTPAARQRVQFQQQQVQSQSFQSQSSGGFFSSSSSGSSGFIQQTSVSSSSQQQQELSIASSTSSSFEGSSVHARSQQRSLATRTTSQRVVATRSIVSSSSSSSSGKQELSTADQATLRSLTEARASGSSQLRVVESQSSRSVASSRTVATRTTLISSTTGGSSRSQVISLISGGLESGARVANSSTEGNSGPSQQIAGGSPISPTAAGSRAVAVSQTISSSSTGGIIASSSSTTTRATSAKFAEATGSAASISLPQAQLARSLSSRESIRTKAIGHEQSSSSSSSLRFSSDFSAAQITSSSLEDTTRAAAGNQQLEGAISAQQKQQAAPLTGLRAQALSLKQASTSGSRAQILRQTSTLTATTASNQGSRDIVLSGETSISPSGLASPGFAIIKSDQYSRQITEVTGEGLAIGDSSSLTTSSTASARCEQEVESAFGSTTVSAIEARGNILSATEIETVVQSRDEKNNKSLRSRAKSSQVKKENSEAKKVDRSESQSTSKESEKVQAYESSLPSDLNVTQTTSFSGSTSRVNIKQPEQVTSSNVSPIESAPNPIAVFSTTESVFNLNQQREETSKFQPIVDSPVGQGVEIDSSPLATRRSIDLSIGHSSSVSFEQGGIDSTQDKSSTATFGQSVASSVQVAQVNRAASTAIDSVVKQSIVAIGGPSTELDLIQQQTSSQVPEASIRSSLTGRRSDASGFIDQSQSVSHSSCLVSSDTIATNRPSTKTESSSHKVTIVQDSSRSSTEAGTLSTGDLQQGAHSMQGSAMNDPPIGAEFVELSPGLHPERSIGSDKIPANILSTETSSKATTETGSQDLLVGSKHKRSTMEQPGQGQYRADTMVQTSASSSGDQSRGTNAAVDQLAAQIEAETGLDTTTIDTSIVEESPMSSSSTSESRQYNNNHSGSENSAGHLTENIVRSSQAVGGQTTSHAADDAIESQPSASIVPTRRSQATRAAPPGRGISAEPLAAGIAGATAATAAAVVASTGPGLVATGGGDGGGSSGGSGSGSGQSGTGQAGAGGDGGGSAGGQLGPVTPRAGVNQGSSPASSSGGMGYKTATALVVGATVVGGALAAGAVAAAKATKAVVPIGGGRKKVNESATDPPAKTNTSTKAADSPVPKATKRPNQAPNSNQKKSNIIGETAGNQKPSKSSPSTEQSYTDILPEANNYSKTIGGLRPTGDANFAGPKEGLNQPTATKGPINTVGQSSSSEMPGGRTKSSKEPVYETSNNIKKGPRGVLSKSYQAAVNPRQTSKTDPSLETRITGIGAGDDAQLPATRQSSSNKSTGPFVSGQPGDYMAQEGVQMVDGIDASRTENQSSARIVPMPRATSRNASRQISSNGTAASGATGGTGNTDSNYESGKGALDESYISMSPSGGRPETTNSRPSGGKAASIAAGALVGGSVGAAAASRGHKNAAFRRDSNDPRDKFGGNSSSSSSTDGADEQEEVDDSDNTAGRDTGSREKLNGSSRPRGGSSDFGDSSKIPIISAANLNANYNTTGNGPSHKQSDLLPLPMEKELPQRSYPKQVFFIVTNEFCERFSYYGLRCILVLYLRTVLGFSDADSVVSFHLFSALCFLTPLMGAILADSYWGKYKTILYLSVLYFVGELVLLTSSVFWNLGNPSVAATLLGLLLIGVGTGGIKPCVSALGGDQFRPHETRWRQTFFSLFYGAINVGALLSMFITPILRSEFRCVNRNDCYPYAFGLPCALMLIAILVFVAAKNRYHQVPLPGQNIMLAFCSCVWLASRRKFAGGRKQSPSQVRGDHWSALVESSENTSSSELSMGSYNHAIEADKTSYANGNCHKLTAPTELLPIGQLEVTSYQRADAKLRTLETSVRVTQESASEVYVLVTQQKCERSSRSRHWLYLAADRFDKQSIEDFRTVLSILFLMVPIPVYWCLFDQQSSLWTLQATRMDGRLFGSSFVLQPDQMGVFNPLLLLLAIPLFEVFIYPTLGKCNLLKTPISRITAGGLLAAVVFLLSALIEWRINQFLPPIEPPMGHANLVLVNGLNDCLLQNPSISYVEMPANFANDLANNHLPNFNSSEENNDDIEHNILTVGQSLVDLNPLGSKAVTVKSINSSNPLELKNYRVTFKLTDSHNDDNSSQQSPLGCPLEPGISHELSLDPLAEKSTKLLYIEQGNGKLSYRLFDEPLGLPVPGKARIRLLYEFFGSVSQANNRQFYLKHPQSGDKSVFSANYSTTYLPPPSSMKFSGFISSGQVLLSQYMDINVEPKGQTFVLMTQDPLIMGNKEEHKINLQPGTRNLLIVHQTDASNVNINHELLQDNDYRISMLWQLGPYLLISMSEVMFSITGLEFSYSMAPQNMKSIILAAWSLTTTFGNLLTVAVEAMHLFSNVMYDFVFYAAIMMLDMIVFAYIGYHYKPQNNS